MVRAKSILRVKEGKALQWSHVFSDMVRSNCHGATGDQFDFNGAMSFQTW